MATATALIGAVALNGIACPFACSAACSVVIAWPGPPGACVGSGMRYRVKPPGDAAPSKHVGNAAVITTDMPQQIWKNAIIIKLIFSASAIPRCFLLSDDINVITTVKCAN